MAKSVKKAPKKVSKKVVTKKVTATKKVAPRKTVKAVVVKKNFFKTAFSSVKAFFKKVFSKIAVFFKNLKSNIKTNKTIVTKVLIVVAFILSFVLIDFLVQYLNNGYSAAIVNGNRIARSEYVNRLEKAYGVTAINRLIEEQLIETGAKQKGVTVTTDEVNTRVTEYYNQNGGRDTVLTALKANALDEKDLIEQIRLAILQEKALTGDIKYDDKVLEKFFNDYKTEIYGEEKVKFADKKAEVTEYYISYQIQQLSPTWIAELQKTAKIQNNVVTEPTYGVLKTTINIIENLYTTIKNSSREEVIILLA